MRYVRIFLLHFEEAFEYRSISVVYFLIGLFNTVLYLLFWRAATGIQGVSSSAISFTDITGYYLLLIFAGATITSHVENSIAYEDIKEGGLARYLMRPFSYIQTKMLEELPWRLIQAVISILVVSMFILFLQYPLPVGARGAILILGIMSCILGYCIAFFMKVLLGITSLWITEYGGLLNVSNIVNLIFAGFVIPLHFLPTQIFSIVRFLPFASMIYYPVLILQGKLLLNEVVIQLAIQIMWLLILMTLYRTLWNKGIRKFTAVGQ